MNLQMHRLPPRSQTLGLPPRSPNVRFKVINTYTKSLITLITFQDRAEKRVLIDNCETKVIKDKECPPSTRRFPSAFDLQPSAFFEEEACQPHPQSNARNANIAPNRPRPPLRGHTRRNWRPLRLDGQGVGWLSGDGAGAGSSSCGVSAPKK